MSKTPLTAKAIEAAQPQDKPYKLTDSLTPGLFLLVHPNGSKYWRFRYWIDKKERLQAIGVYPLISLKEARKRATESRLLIAQGIDPMDLARKEKAIDALNAIASFKAVAEDWMATKVSGWSESYTKQVRSALEKDVYPVLGKRSIVDITARDVLALLQKKERTAPEQARKLRQRIGEIFKFAVITELVNRNPVADLDTALKARRPGHNAWIPINEIPAFYKALERAGSVQIQTAIRLLILSALRTAELRLMRWEWVDLESATITLPAEVMKARRPHVVPLSRQAVELLQDQFTRSGYSAFVFPGRFMDNKPLSASAILKALERIGYKSIATGHGWRTTFSTALNESGRYSPDWIEIQLAHVPKGVRGVYNQAAYLKQRRAMMQDYADAIDSILAGDGNPLEP
ncbi:tyrosine-type recombinase/integrase [Escherichia coli]|uniref:tyrosine-type recombinase/integrase n=1 Tax=Escherichia coli TaxID=562 RepID=UPI000BE22B59|nr:integrase arm-type DNA-binding domain-containing protein [Escherichia coli]EFC5289832.1 tyrosine-type recombinase/integrase [Escherichia coli]EFC5347018.1 tyrosine-type recombinase/integrase [Escherichia coli]EIH2566466.1 tyrosine-type recombinase/integrase [Escherichia coli]MBB7598416.1 tyrosine-type recombinase/integrase [Escherichia coli]